MHRSPSRRPRSRPIDRTSRRGRPGRAGHLLLAALAVGAPCAVALAGPAPTSGPDELPVLRVEADDTLVTRSCRVVVPAGLVLADAAGDGVLQIGADDLRLVFEPGIVLRGAAPGTPGDTLTGVGIAIEGHSGVTVEGARLAGFAIGLLARDAHDLSLLDLSVLEGRRQRLASTAAAADDGADWISPHDNDERQWVLRYGAGLCVERSRGVRVQGCRVRDTQNGLILDRVSESAITANDFSFLSGWGLAMWRCDRNLVAGNALDYCIRGYSHGVYNRGQDSAGLLLFEQCHDNLIEGNSISHGGDGVFAFAGREALGERAELPGGHAGLGHRGNLFVGNDLSFAAAHGLELTFAQANTIEGNRFEGNAICGVWGGYSRDLDIARNLFVGNGDAGYGPERGGVDIEHGARNRIAHNTFLRDRCGVRLWWDPDEHLASLPWALANGVECGDNALVGNRFAGTDVAVELADCRGTSLDGNLFLEVGTKLAVVGDPPLEHELAEEPRRAALSILREALASPPRWPEHAAAPPTAVPSGRRGRQHVLMTEWGPWDLQRPAWRVLSLGAGGHAFEALGVQADAGATFAGDGLKLERDGDTFRVTPAPGARGPLVYRLAVDGLPPREGTLVAARWEVTCFPTTADPREDEAAFAAAARGDQAITVTLDALQLPYGSGGPSDLATHADLAAAGLPRDHFGTVARARVPLPAGAWRLSTLSDDGLRVRVDGVLVIDDWTWHAPKHHALRLEREADGEVLIEVEHFELDGWSVLQLELAPAD